MNAFCKSFWNKVKNITDHRSREITQPLFDNSGTLQWGDQEIRNILIDKHINRSDIHNNYFFDESFHSTVNSNNDNLLNSDGPIPEIFERPISIKEIKEELSNLNGHGTPGPPSEGLTSPGIPPILLKKSIDEISPFLKILFDIFWPVGDFPKVLPNHIEC